MDEEVKPNTQAAIDFLRKWRVGGPWTIVAFNPEGNNQTAGITFREENLEEGREFIDKWNGKWNLYFHSNSLMRDMNKKAQRTDVKSLDCLHVDQDPKEKMDLKSEQELIFDSFLNPPAGIPAPSVIIFSGGGYQGFWLLEEPLQVDGDLAKVEDAKRYSQQLEVLYGDRADATHNLDRVMRLPGSVNIPNPNKLKKGRKPALARLIKFDEKLRYPLSRFTQAALVQTASGNLSLNRAVEVKVSGNVRRLDSIDELDQWNVPTRVKVICVQGRDPDNPKEGDNSRSAWLFDAVCNLVRADVPDDVIFSIITDPDFGISGSVIDKGSISEKYAIKQISEAKEHADNPMLRMLNSKHAVISDMGGKCRVIQEVYDPALKRNKISKQSFEDFRNRYMNQIIDLGVGADGKPIRAQAGKWWLGHQKRRQYESIVFAPNTETPDMYNLWRGFACEARPGDCSLLLEHLMKNVCGGNKVHYDYLIGWCASAIQKPDSPGQVAIVMRGLQGTGKSFFAKQFGSLWGRHFLHVSNPNHLVGNFNTHLRDCVVLFADEAFYAGDKRHESILKTLITEETIVFEGKGVDAEAGPNYTHVMLASNNQWVVPAGATERRYFVLDVGREHMQDSGYFQNIAAQMNSGGREAFLHFLLTYDLSEYNVRNVPKTSALHDQKMLSMSPEEEWWYQKLQEGRILFGQEEWSTEVMKDYLMDDYINYMKRINVQRRASSTSLGKFLQRIVPGSYPRSYQKNADVEVQGNDGYIHNKRRRAYFYEFPTLRDCREHWNAIFGEEDWEEVPML